MRFGQEMWNVVEQVFTDTASGNLELTHTQKARIWAGFLASAAGAMAHDLGKGDAVVVLQGVVAAIGQFHVPTN